MLESSGQFDPTRYIGKRVQIKSLIEEILEGEIIRRLLIYPFPSRTYDFLVKLDKEVTFPSPFFKWWHNFRRKRNRPKKELSTRFVIIDFRNPDNVEKELHGFVESELSAPIAAYVIDQGIAESENSKLSEWDVRNGKIYPIGPARVQIIEDESK